jgi:aminoglycoside phosphotransferase (APT) family kinase protein
MGGSARTPLSSSTALVGLDVDAAAEWLISDVGGGLRGPIRFERIGRGQSNLTFLAVDASGHRLILRRPPLGHLLASAHDVAREHRILCSLDATPVPTPSVVAFTDDPAVTDVPLLVVEHVDGLVVDDPAVARELAPEDRGRLGVALVEALARVHAVDLERTGLIDLASHKPYAARQLKRWRRQWEDSSTRELPAVIDLAHRLEAAIPEQDELTLVHGDFHLANVIASPDGGSIRAVLDWELCTLGDPLADLGGLLAYWPEPGDASFFPAPTLPGFPSRNRLIEAYADASGRDVTHTGFWHALGLWKIAIISEGVRRRALDDPRNAASGGTPTTELVDDLFVQATDAADAAGI